MDVNLTIDGKAVSVPNDTVLLEASRQVGSQIPTICYHQATTSNSICRICVVEIEGQRLLQPACTVVAAEGMKVQTHSERVMKVRRTILEMLAASIDLSDAPEILELIYAYQASTDRFPNSTRRSSAILDDNPMFIRDYSKCILCWRCVQVCADDAQYVQAINFKNRGFQTQISTFYDKPLPTTTCVFCGQCIGVCPTGALKTKSEFLIENGFTPEQISLSSVKPKHSKR